MTYSELKEFLFKNKDDNFALFSKRLSNSTYISIGIKTTVLRNLVKEHYDDEELKLNDFVLGEYLEIDYLYFALGLVRCGNIDDQLSFLDKNLKYASSWVITDSLSTFFKRCSYDKFLSFFMSHYKNEHIYTRSFSYVFALHFSKEKRILDLLPLIQLKEEYMVLMAEAWLLSFIAIEYKKEVYNYLSQIDDKELIRKTINKISDSYRFDSEEKEKFKSLRDTL